MQQKTTIGDMYNERIYHILIDRFSTGDDLLDKKLAYSYEIDFMGGNLNGIIKKLDYIKELGFSAIWLSPIFKGNDYHGYHVTDFFEVDPHFGSLKELKRLIRKAHECDIKIIIDIVPNHVYETHPFFLDTKQNPKSKYRDWFVWTKSGDYLKFLTYKWLPKLNTRNPEVQEYLLEVMDFYLNIGIDGFRVDHAYGLAREFAEKALKYIIDKKGKNVHYFGECWLDPQMLSKYYVIKTLWLLNRGFSWSLYIRLQRILFRNDFVVGQNIREKMLPYIISYFNGLLDFYTNQLIRKNINSPENLIMWVIKARNLSESVDKPLYKFLDNHDMERFLTVVNNDLNLMKIALAIEYLAFEDPVIVYYGTEIPLGQPKRFSEFENHRDVLSRIFMPWNEKQELREYLKILNAIKSQMISSKVEIVRNPGTAIKIDIETKDKNYLVIINPSRKETILDSSYEDVETGLNLRYVPPMRAKIFEA